MRDMKNSGIEWIGEIPKDWQTITNKYNFDLNKEIIGSRWNTTQLLSLTKNGIKKIVQGEQTGKVPSSFSTYQKVNRNNIVMCLFDLDCSAVFSGISKFNGMISPAYKCFKCKKHLYPLYVDYYFRAVFVDRKYKRYSKNIRYSLTSDEFFSLPILVPKLEEQKQIADFLDHKCFEIDALRLEIEKEIATLKEYKKSIITEAVTKGLNKNVPMKDSGIEWIGEIPKDWNADKIKYHFSNNKIIVGNNADKYERLALTLNGVVKRPKDDDKGLQPEKFDSYQILKPNELVFKLIDLQNLSTSRIGLSPYLGLVSSSYIIISTKKSIVPSFAEKYFVSMWQRRIFNALGDSGVRSSLSANYLLNLSIVYPSIHEQKQIADYLDHKCSNIDDIIKLKNKQLSTLDEYKKSLIYEYVTGKKEVPSV